MNTVDVQFAKEGIRRFLEAAPGAADTDRGIHDYWINWEEPRPYVDVTTEALKSLEADGVVESCMLEDGRLVWRARMHDRPVPT